MAPALPAPPRDRSPTPRRRPLAAVDPQAMEDADMGLQSQPSLAKDSQEMEQILVDLGSSDLAQSDLLQAIKTLESASADALSTGDPDAIFPLSGFDLAEVADSEGDAVEDKIKQMQARMERRCAFLQRRLRILQARAIGKRVSEEVAQTFEKCTRGARKDGVGRPVGLKAMLKRIETTANLQASAASRTVAGPTYYNPGTSKVDTSRSATVGISSGTLTGLQDTAGALRSHLSVVKHELDSDATASSSGAESNDEAVTYNNPHQQPMPIEKRALWRWQRARGSIAARWGWLQAQVQELEYKIRQHTELHKQVREAKGPVEFEGEPAAYEGSLPGAEPAENDPAAETCARVRPLKRETFRKRKLLQMHNLHIATNKAAKSSDISCSCMYPDESCPVCTGRAEPLEPLAADSTLSAAQRLARTDPAYHPVLSTPHDIRCGVHLAALSGRPWFRARMARPARPAPPQPAPAPAPASPVARPSKKHHPSRTKRGRPPLSRKLRMARERERSERDEDSISSVTNERRVAVRGSTESRGRRSYDIDSIVIPASVAANTRPQILTYKEIITPKWRVLDIPEVPLNNGVLKSAHRMSIDSEEEDISEWAVSSRHQRALARERSRYLLAARPRRRHSAQQADSAQGVPEGGDGAPMEWDPARPPERPAAPPTETVVRPYSPRRFPLREDTYLGMLSAMPSGHSAPPSPPRPSPPSPPDEPPSPPRSPDIDVDDSSTLSPLSPNPYDGDDPDDQEWDPSAEKQERRKSGFR